MKKMSYVEPSGYFSKEMMKALEKGTKKTPTKTTTKTTKKPTTKKKQLARTKYTQG